MHFLLLGQGTPRLHVVAVLGVVVHQRHREVVAAEHAVGREHQPAAVQQPPTLHHQRDLQRQRELAEREDAHRVLRAVGLLLAEVRGGEPDLLLELPVAKQARFTAMRPTNTLTEEHRTDV